MATYQYRCAEDGVFDVSKPMGTATPQWPCPGCGRDAGRVFSAPMLALAPGELVAAIDRTEQSRDEPEVVAALPPRRTRALPPAATRHPALSRLPKP